MTKRPNAKLTLEQAREIVASTEPGKVLAHRYGVTPSNISSIRLGKSWREAADDHPH